MLKHLTLGAMCMTMIGGAKAQDTEPWDADARIRQHRMAPLTVEVVDAEGEPVPNAAVEVKQTRHAFRFGTAVNRALLAGEKADTEDAAMYRQKLTELFNAAVLENGHKWRLWEKPEARAETVAATNWLLNRGLHVRGHTLVWQHKKKSWSVPDDVFDSDDPGHIRQRVADHIRDEITYSYGKHRRLDEWDLLNEAVSENVLTEKLTPDVPSEEAPDLVKWFETAHDAAPDVRLYINDFHILVGDYAEHRESHERTIRFLLDQNAPVHGIGFQGHYHGGHLTPPIQQVRERLDHYAAFGLPLLITEFDMFGKNWLEGQKAAWMRDFLTMCYSHPAVEGFYLWGFWDGRHWADDAPLFSRDWALKPEGQVWMDLVYGAWWTDASGKTNAEGRYEVHVTLGEHAVTVTGPDGRVATATAEVTRDEQPVVVVELR